MATGYDGSIKIDTRIDNTGVEKGVKATGNEIRKLSSVVGNLFGSNNKIDKFNSKLAKATEAVNKQRAEVRYLEQAYNQLLNGDVKPKALISLQKELEKAQKQLVDADSKVEKLASDYKAIESKGFKTNSGATMYSPEDKISLQQLDADFSKSVDSADTLRTKVNQLKAEISSIQTNPQNSAEAQQYASKIELAKQKLARLSQEEVIASKNAKKLGTSGTMAMKSTRKATDSATNAVKRFSRRVFSLIRSALIFSVITKAFTKLRESFGSLLNADKEASGLFSQIKGNLLTAFAPIYYYVLPAIKTLLQWLAKLTSSMAYLVSGIFGKSISQSQQMAQNMYNQSKATDKSTKALNKNTDAMKRSVAGFDKLNDITETKAPDTSDSASSDSPTMPSFKLEEMDTKKYDELKEKLKNIFWWVAEIGAALLAWKISSLFTKNIKTIAGIVATVYGTIKFIKHFSDAWVNGIDWENFKGIMIALLIVVGGLALSFGMLGAGIGLIIGSIAMIVLAIKDMKENGINLKNSLMLIAGVIGAVIAVALILAAVGVAVSIGWVLAIAAIAAAVAAVVLVIIKYWDKIKVWSKYIFELIGYYWNMMLYGLEVAGVATVNFLIGIFNGMLNIVSDIINSIIRGLNKLPGVSIGVVDWQIPELKMPKRPVKPKVPKLAQGAVIPANSEFLAILGDQKSGRNLEAPESLIRQIVREESGNANRDDMIAIIFSAIKMAKDAGLLASDVLMDGQKVGKLTAPSVGNEFNRSGFVLRTAKG